ncbi:hypothetical protein B0H14DRAFT_3863050 [Mycena olivaceomarginata]|nr:hypothetical protein B0H14DRAFT_3863050 [Mycena olivaceomarginata]
MPPGTPVSRYYLNRVSFRLLVCALISNLIFAATSIPVFSRPSAGCSFMAFFGLSILMFSACMFFCIALNLQLVLVHYVNGNVMEKFYYIGSVAVVAILNIAPYAAGQFGYYNGTCWFSNPRPDVQFRWLLGSQSVWMLLMSTGEVVSFLVILGYMYRVSTPLLSCCLNFTGSILDIWLSKNPVPTELQWRLSFVDLCVFGLRPILYTCLAAADPGFLCGLRALRNYSKSTHSTGPISTITFTNSSPQEKSSTTWAAGSSMSRVEQSSAALRPFEEQTAEPQQNGLSQAERGKEVEVEVEVDAQTRSGSEDIVRQI